LVVAAALVRFAGLDEGGHGLEDFVGFSFLFVDKVQGV
jgi:hypothetical protein